MSTSRFLDAKLVPSRRLSSLSRHTRGRELDDPVHVRRRNPSIVSVGQPRPSVNGDESDDQWTRSRAHSISASDEIIAMDDGPVVPSDEHRLCSLTQMLFVYAQKVNDDPLATPPRTSSYDALDDVIDVLELHFSTYADEKQRVYFEDIFRILHDFHEHITEASLIDTFQTLQV